VAHLRRKWHQVARFLDPLSLVIKLSVSGSRDRCLEVVLARASRRPSIKVMEIRLARINCRATCTVSANRTANTLVARAVAETEASHRTFLNASATWQFECDDCKTESLPRRPYHLTTVGVDLRYVSRVVRETARKIDRMPAGFSIWWSACSVIAIVPLPRRLHYTIIRGFGFAQQIDGGTVTGRAHPAPRHRKRVPLRSPDTGQLDRTLGSRAHAEFSRSRIQD
jgi:hypothetical protein